MDSKEAAASTLSDSPSGSSPPIKTPFFNDSQYQNARKINGLNSDTEIIKKNNGSSSRSSSSSSDDYDGFVSGGEEFEPAVETPLPVSAEETLEETESFVDSSEFPMTKAELLVENFSADDDDVEKVARVLEGGEVEGDGVVLGKDYGIGSGSNVGGEVFDEKPEKTEESVSMEVLERTEVKLGESLSSIAEGSSIPENKEAEEIKLKDEENSVTENEGVKLTAEGVSVVEAIQVEMPVLGVLVVGDVEENEKVALVNGSGETSQTVEPARSKSVDANESEALINQPGETSQIDVPAESELVDANGVKLTTEGDSVVEAIQVEMPEPGAAVVGDPKENGSVALINGSGQARETVELAMSDVVDANGLNVTEEGSIVEDIDADTTVPGAVVGKMEEDGIADGTAAVINGSGQSNHTVEEVVDKEVIGVTDDNIEATDKEVDGATTDNIATGKVQAVDVEDFVTANVVEQIQEVQEVYESAEKSESLQPEAASTEGSNYEAKENESVVEIAADGVEVASKGDTAGSEVEKVLAADVIPKTTPIDSADDEKHIGGDHVSAIEKDVGLQNELTDKFILEESAEVVARDDTDEEGDIEGSVSDEETDGVIFGSSEAAKLFIEELERGSGGDSHSGGESSHDHSQMIDGQIATDSDEEGEGKELFDSAALAALLKAATGGGSEGGNITITSQDGSSLFSVERPAGLGSSLQSLRPAPRPTRSNIFTSSSLVSGGESDGNLSEEEKKKLEKLQSIRVKFLRLVQRLGLSPDESVAAQVLYRLALVAGRQTGQLFSLDAAKRKAMELEAEGEEDLDFSVNILVIGKSGVGKSATINSIFGEDKAKINAFQPSTTTVKEITGMVDGVKVRVFDMPGLKSSVMDQGFNRSVLSSAQRFTKKNPPDIILYVDRLDAQTRDLNDLPLLRTVTSSLGPSIWRSAIVTLTHAASAPPDGPSGSPLSYEVFVTQRSHVVQQCIGQAVGDLRMMSPSLMNPVSLVENHPSCRKNREGQKVLPNGQSWRPQLLLLCYSMKILSDANSLSKPQDPFDHRKLFGFRVRSPPLPYMLSSMLQSRAHPKLSSEQGGDNGDSDVDLADLSDFDQEEVEDEYDQLPPFKPLKKSQLSKLSKEQRNAYFEEYDYRVKLLQKKQWKEELKRMREMKKKGKDAVSDYGYMEEEADEGAPAPVAVPLPDMVLPPSFDGDNPAYRFRFLEPTSQFLARPVLDTHGWDHDCGYDGVNLEQSLAIASRYPAVVSAQITKDKKDFSITMDSSVSARHGENGSSMVGFDVQPIGKQLAYIVRGETKFKNLKKNKTAAGISVTFLGENVVTGFKVEDQIAFGKQYSVVGSAGTVRFQNDSAYGANIEVQRRELDYPIGQVQSTFGLSLIKWRGDLALGFNSLAQFSVGRSSKVAVRAGINNKLSGQITVRTSSSEHLSLALAAVLPTAIAIYQKLWPDVGEKYPIY